MTPDFTVSSRSGDYGVYLAPGLLGDLGGLVRSVGTATRVALVSDNNVLARWGAQATASLVAAGIEVNTIELLPGEATKSLETAGRVYGRLIEKGFTREDVVVALGGGVIGDLAGFVAATFHRGMPLVQVPTTVLAQADSSIGGKVGVNHALGKNLIGAFHHPLLVVGDVHTLGTLPTRERWNGLAEVVKVALTSDAALVASLERDLEGIADGTASEKTIAAAIRGAAAIKARVVSGDEREQGERLLLNFGHTLGHAVEVASGYGPVLHGEAVVAGMKAAVAISLRLGRIAEADARRASALLGRFPAPKPWGLRRETILLATGRDKKRQHAGLRFIVLNGIGRAEVLRSLPDDALEAGAEVILSSEGPA